MKRFNVNIKTQNNEKNVFSETLFEMYNNAKYALIHELNKIAIFIQIIIPLILLKMNKNMIVLFIVSCVLTAFIYYIKEVGYKLNHTNERGFPVPVERFTKIDNNGFVYIPENMTQNAILYLSDIEDYLESRGNL